jgi:hypothetical protein
VVEDCCKPLILNSEFPFDILSDLYGLMKVVMLSGILLHSEDFYAMR